MAEPDRGSPSSSSSVNHRDFSDAVPSSSNLSHAREEEEEHGHGQHYFELRPPEIEHHQPSIYYQGNFSPFNESSAVSRDDTWSCVIVVLTFWIFVSMTLILGVYGSSTLRLGPNGSLLLQPNPVFVQYVKVEELNESKPGPILYGFYKTPPLDNATTWSESHNVSVAADNHQEWIYFLNEGSKIEISYDIKPERSSIFLVIAEGSEGFAQWLEDPTYPNTTLLWNVIQGSGDIQQNITSASSYYIAVGNLNSEDVKVQLNFRIEAILYNTTRAYFKCTFIRGSCGLDIVFPEGNAALLTSPGPTERSTSEECYVKLSYGPRWATYVLGIGGMTAVMLVAFNFLNKFPCAREERTNIPFIDARPERAPLLSYKDDDLSSWGSSCDSGSNDEENFEDLLAAGSVEGKSINNAESNNTRRLCAICFDAPRDCFFLPCGHCVACYECGTRIVEAAGTCPICRRNMKKVRKIFTV